jgi:hypothetical protein
MGEPEKKANKWLKEKFKELKKYAKGRMSLDDAADNSTEIKNPDQAVPTVKQVLKHKKRMNKKASEPNKKGY